ncbi:MAG: GAF domain-containing sensor histidine kinase [Deltaproteobacteria bacterium]|nr:GAF domain-containing sensor histidine kinase [Deltaproteobacteria bacterium]
MLFCRERALVPDGLEVQVASERSHSKASLNQAFDWEAGADERDLEQVIAEKDRQLAALREIAMALGTTLDIDELLQIFMRHITALLAADRSTLYLIDDERCEMWSKIAQGEERREIRLQIGQGLAGWVGRHGEPINIADAYNDERFNPEVDRQTGYRTGSVLAMPVRNARGALLGVVQVLNKRDGVFSSADELLLDALTSQIAVAIENAKLYQQALLHNQQLKLAHDQLARKMKELDLLFEVEQAMGRAVTLDDLLATVLGRTMELIGAEAGSIVLPDDKAGELFFHTALGGSGESLKKVRIKTGEGIAGWVVSNNQPALVDDVSSDERHLASLAKWAGFKPRQILCVPLPGDDRSLGAIELLNKREGSGFTDEDQRLLTLIALQVAGGLGAAREREAREKNARLATIGQMLSAIVHDFKTPMTAIGGYVELMSCCDSADERREYTQVVYRQIDRLQEMIQELLQFARGQTEVLLHKVFVGKFLDEVEAMLKREFASSCSRLELRRLYSGAAHMDENKMHRVMQNIARNAIQAMDPLGGGTFTVTAQQSGDWFELVCQDTGPGIDDAIVDRMFDSFATHGKPDGTGLGLAIVKKIVEQHHGEITFETGAGRGTTFFIRIPLQSASARAQS